MAPPLIPLIMVFSVPMLIEAFNFFYSMHPFSFRIFNGCLPSHEESFSDEDSTSTDSSAAEFVIIDNSVQATDTLDIISGNPNPEAVRDNSNLDNESMDSLDGLDMTRVVTVHPVWKPNIICLPVDCLCDEKVLKSEVQLKDSLCAICLRHYKPGEFITEISKCEHYFHRSCIDKWFRTRANCPMCRHQLGVWQVWYGMWVGKGQIRQLRANRIKE